jgi:hypothetical protein
MNVEVVRMVSIELNTTQHNISEDPRSVCVHTVKVANLLESSSINSLYILHYGRIFWNINQGSVHRIVTIAY